MEKLILILSLILLLNCKNGVSSDQKEEKEMSTIIELLGVAKDDMFFVVDTSQENVVINYPAEPYLLNTSGKKLLKAGDNFQILSYMIKLPLCFRLVEDEKPNYLELQYQEDGSGQKHVFSKLFIPFENYEMNLGTFFDFASDLPEKKDKFFLLAELVPGVRVDMYNVPDDLDGESFPVKVYVKIRHNFELE